MTPEREALYESLVIERFAPRHIRPPSVVCGGCGQWANPDEPCPECRIRRNRLKEAHRERTAS